MSLQAEALEKKKMKKKKTKPSSPTSSSSSPSFSSIPDEITVNYLARISRRYYPKLSIVSKSFHSILSSTELYRVRSHLGNTEKYLYICLSDKSYKFPQWFTICINPNRRKKTPGQVLVPIKSSNFRSLSSCSIVVGYDIYVIGGPIENLHSSAVRILDCRSHTWRDGPIENLPSSAVRILDCRSHTWREAPSMNVARYNPLACFYDGKIYVIEGVRVEDELWAEVFDIKTQTWERLTHPGTGIHKSSIFRIAEIKGNICFKYGLEYPVKTYVYDPKQGKWESCNGVVTFPESDCVIDGVWYKYCSSVTRGFMWSTGGCWIDVKGLESLRGDKYGLNSGPASTRNTTNKLVSCGGKLYLVWQGDMDLNPNTMKKIWCAEIAVEKRDGGEVWGNVEWVDVILSSVPKTCQILNCLVVSV